MGWIDTGLRVDGSGPANVGLGSGRGRSSPLRPGAVRLDRARADGEPQPGDLVFYAEGGIYHVVMYIGNGQVVQAEDTGTVISITPLWPDAYGAGRP